MGVIDHDTAAELLGAYALHACEDDEATLIATHVEGCETCDIELARLREAASWLATLGNSRPPDGLRETALGAARERRSSEPPGTPASLLTDHLDRLDAILDTISGDEWRAVTRTGWTVHEFVAHLLAGASLINVELGAVDADPFDAGTEWEARTVTVLAQEADHDPPDTVAAWRRQAHLLRQSVDALTPEDLRREIPWFGATAPIGDVVVTHGFELWVHTEDVRLALGRGRQRPADRHLAVMAELAARLLSLALHGRGSRIRLVLTGGGGGTWPLPLDGDGASDAVLTADVVDFCTLIGGRLHPADLAHSAQGDETIVADALRTAATFAFT